MPDNEYSLLDGIPLQWYTFLDTPPEESDPAAANVFVVPLPYDSTTSYKGGARDGPHAILNASRQLEDYDLELDRDISTIGIHTMPEVAPDMSSPEAMTKRVREVVSAVAGKDKLVAILGGEHSITVGAVQALSQVHPDLSVLYLDAHADMRDTYLGTRWGHASAARRIQEICPLVEVGVRSLSADEMSFIRDKKLPVFFWKQGETSVSRLIHDIVSQLSDHVYISIDLDVFDPSIMSAVGTPEPGGMSWAEVTELLRAVGEQRRIVGFDLTELSPAEGPESCAYTAAKLAYKIMGYATQRS